MRCKRREVINASAWACMCPAMLLPALWRKYVRSRPKATLLAAKLGQVTAPRKLTAEAATRTRCQAPGMLSAIHALVSNSTLSIRFSNGVCSLVLLQKPPQQHESRRENPRRCGPISQQSSDDGVHVLLGAGRRSREISLALLLKQRRDIVGRVAGILRPEYGRHHDTPPDRYLLA